MKTSHKLMALCFLFCSLQCTREFYYMPFKETSNGTGKVSLYLDGEPYASLKSNGTDVQCIVVDNMTTFVMRGSCEHVLHGMKSANIEISIKLEESPFKTGHEYKVTPYTQPAEAQEDPVEDTYIRICVNGIYAESGWIKFRYFSSNIAAGNFECTFTDQDGIVHSLHFGNFDASID